MITRIMRSFLILWMIICLSGCSSVLTYYAPLKSKMVDGEKRIGERRSYEYSSSSGHSNKIYFEKKPLCGESVMKMRYAQKELRCFSCALFELIFYGLGLFDMLTAYTIVEDSKKIEPLAEYDTGKLVVCGPVEPAADEVVVINNPKTGMQRIATTDSSGVIDLDQILSDLKDTAFLKIHLKSDPGRTFDYFYKPTRQASYSHKRE